MLIERYMLIFVESYTYFRVIYLLENYHRLYFSTVESYVYYEFLKLYFLKSFKEVYVYIYQNVLRSCRFYIYQKVIPIITLYLKIVQVIFIMFYTL